MRSPKTLPLAVLSAAALAGAFAAAAAPAGRWEGSYLGVTAGYGDDWTLYQDANYDWFGATNANDPAGAVFGLQGGHNWQDGTFAWGIEADILGTAINHDAKYSNSAFIHDEVNWLASLRPRAGFAFGDTFLYQTVGVTLGDFTRSWTVDDGIAPDVSDSWPNLGSTKLGVVAGFGIERFVGGHWSLRAEAQARHFFENASWNANGLPLRITDDVFTLNAGLNYAFGERPQSNAPFVQGRPFDFSGPFVGLSFGGHLADIQLTDVDYDWYGSTYDLHSAGPSGGLQFGYNMQSDGFVYGAEGAFRFFDGHDSTSDGSLVTQSAANWSGDLKLKAGAAAGNTMMYLLAGYALGNYDLSYDNGTPIDLKGTHAGFLAGTGIEQVFTPNLSGRIEASFTALDGDKTTTPTVLRGSFRDAAVMAGVNYYMGDRAMGTGALAPRDWTGFNAGLDALFAYHQGIIFDRVSLNNGGSYSLPSFGAGAGAHIGYDWQADSFVFGAIADFQIFSNEQTDISAPQNRGFSSSLDWIGTLRGRAGVATGDALFFATGGVAFGGVDLDFDYFPPSPVPRSIHFGNDRLGWTVGLGVEEMLSAHASLRFETLYTKFGEASAGNGFTCPWQQTTQPCEMLGYDDTITVKAAYSLRWGAN